MSTSCFTPNQEQIKLGSRVLLFHESFSSFVLDKTFDCENEEDGREQGRTSARSTDQRPCPSVAAIAALIASTAIQYALPVSPSKCPQPPSWTNSPASFRASAMEPVPLISSTPGRPSVAP